MEEMKLNNEVVAENAITDDTEIDVGMIETSILFDRELHKEQHVWLLKGSIWKTYPFSKILDLIHRLQREKKYKTECYDELCDRNNDMACEIANQKAEIERLTECLKDLDWYKMWHKKFKKKIDDLTLELETYRPTKLSGNGQCKCSNCGDVSWTDWFSRYKGKTLCDKCLKEIISTEEKQTVKDTAKEIYELAVKHYNYDELGFFDELKERYGVEVE